LLPFLPVIRRVFVEPLRIASPFGHWTLDLCHDSGHTADPVPGQGFTCASFHPVAGDTSRFGAFNPPDFGNSGTENPGGVGRIGVWIF